MGNKDSSHRGAGGLFIPAGLLLGMGLGFLYDELVAGLFIGLGCGFIAFGIITLIENLARK
ncbi:hypothetical protein GF323_04755 [Candidatus Woesearchaeota archaeon]|nr:hypothetical protein [Candidatus Woesearchaeota archaeon]